MKNTSKKTEEKTFTANEVGSMLERIDNSVKILAEGHSTLVDGQNDIKKILTSVDQRLEKVEIRLDSVENRLDSVEDKLELVETKIDRLQDDMVEVKFDLKRKVDAEQFEKLEKRVVKLEKLSLSHQS